MYRPAPRQAEAATRVLLFPSSRQLLRPGCLTDGPKHPGLVDPPARSPTGAGTLPHMPKVVRIPGGCVCAAGHTHARHHDQRSRCSLVERLLDTRLAPITSGCQPRSHPPGLSALVRRGPFGPSLRASRLRRSCRHLAYSPLTVRHRDSNRCEERQWGIPSM